MMTLYQKAYIATLSGAAKTAEIRSKYCSYCDEASTATSAYAATRVREKGNIHAYTKKLTLLNGGVSA